MFKLKFFSSSTISSFSFRRELHLYGKEDPRRDITSCQTREAKTRDLGKASRLPSKHMIPKLCRGSGRGAKAVFTIVCKRRCLIPTRTRRCESGVLELVVLLLFYIICDLLRGSTVRSGIHVSSHLHDSIACAIGFLFIQN